MTPRTDSADGGEGKRSINQAVNQSSNQPGSQGTGQPKQYTCPHCSYSADKKVSLNRHMRMHTASPPTATGAVAAPLQVQVTPSDACVSAADSAAFADRYCQDCDIRFSSLKTFRAHKLHYCSTRHVLKGAAGAAAPGSSESASPSPVDGPAMGPAMASSRTSAPSPGSEALLALPTNPPLLVPYSLLQGASVVQSAALASALGAALGPALSSTCLLWLPDGSLQPVATAATAATAGTTGRQRPTSSTAPAPAPSPSASAQPQASATRRRETKSSPAPGPSSGPGPGLGPLDLSVRRSSDCSDQDEDERAMQAAHLTAEHEDIVCAPSIPLMLSASSTCSSPSPATPLGPSPSPPPPAPPPSRKRPHSPTLSPTTGKKSPRRTPNGVVPHAAKKEILEDSVGGVGPDTQLLLQSVLASRGLAPGLPPGLATGLATGSASLPMLLGNTPLELALRMAAASAASAASAAELHPPPPQVHVKHGVSKCKECNIVFVRHENYLAHKRHYCQARLQDEPPAVEDSPVAGAGSGCASASASRTTRSPSANSPSEPPSGTSASPAGHSPPTLVQYICALCHIKFTSLDNLTHHQAYYCPKRATQDNAPATTVKLVEDKTRRRCPKCKISVPADQLSSHQCDVQVAGSGWRCPCCPVMSPTISAAQKHMESHNGIKAFRCTLCGYKGNTLRGMRTHIRMHFEKGLPDLQEENFITCVMEDDAALPAPVPVQTSLTAPPTPPAPLSLSIAATDASSLPGARPSDSDSEQQFSCDLCSYTSKYKHNLLHHLKSVHGRSKEEGASSGSSNSSRNSEDIRPSNNLNGGDRIAIKEEQQDDEFIAIEDFKVKEELVCVSDVDEQRPVSVITSPQLVQDSKPSIKSTDGINSGEEAVGTNNNKTGPKYCKSCDIAFTYYDTFMVHKKFYCTRSEPGTKVAQASAL